MDMNKSFFLKKEDAKPKWQVIDANGKTLGRLATKIADMLRGKDKAFYTPHTMSGDYIIVINAKNIVMTGKKLNEKIYDRYTGYVGGYKTVTAKEILAKNPDRLITLAVKRMLPKNKLQNHFLTRLKVYADDSHPHQAQIAKK